MMRRMLARLLLLVLVAVVFVGGLAARTVVDAATATGQRPVALLNLSLSGVDVGIDAHPARVAQRGYVEVWVYPINYGNVIVLLRVSGARAVPMMFKGRIAQQQRDMLSPG